MLGWLLIAAFFASLLAVALNAARPPKQRQPQRTVRPARPAAGGVTMATASLTLALNLQRSQGVDTGETLIRWVRQLWLDGRIELDDMEARIARVLRGDRSPDLALAGDEAEAYQRAHARNEAVNALAEADRKRLAAAARFVTRLDPFGG